jgi:YggT family protein
VNNINLLLGWLLILMRIYYYVIFARIILSWFMVGGSAVNPTLSSIYRVVYGLTEPLLAPLRRVIPSVKVGMGYLDLSPLILLILIMVAESIIRNLRF